MCKQFEQDILKDQADIKALEQKAAQQWEWLSKNTNSACFNDVMSDYNAKQFKIDTLRQRIEQRKSGRMVVAVDLPTLPKRTR
jgi:hypothetical protein